MHSLFNGDPSIFLKEKYDFKRQQASIAQRNGDLKEYMQLTHEADEIWLQMEEMESELGHS
ncbi:Lacal_2735 family protein [Catenovulum sp. SM1970]|uniref:DUF6435 family protein n=1 Tax=Marinifaba aquimaris TaxID=2741323 RepID=UPI001574273C|nr:DUF6435 family protein [Marinifaba aquimaris]NTS75817.1 Lacal_2735 family protein [Marinifaba aquimaris]